MVPTIAEWDFNRLAPIFFLKYTSSGLIKSIAFLIVLSHAITRPSLLTKSQLFHTPGNCLELNIITWDGV